MKILSPFLLTLLFPVLSLAQNKDPECMENTFFFFTPMDEFYLSDYCNYAEFGSYEFTIDNGAHSIVKQGIYREVWFNKNEDSKRKITGLQVLQNHQNAIEAVGGEVVKEADGSVFRTTYMGKELWIYITASTYNMDLNNYRIYSIEVDILKQEISALDIQGSIESSGKIALYGILFDTGKSEIKPESENAMCALAGGMRNYDGTMNTLSYLGSWWSVAGGVKENDWNRTMTAYTGYVTRSFGMKNYGYSVRCLKD